VWFAHVRSVVNNISKYQTPIDSSTLWRYVTIVPNLWAREGFYVGHGAISHFDMFKFTERWGEAPLVKLKYRW